MGEAMTTAQPIGYTEARHRALASVHAGTVRYDWERARWMLGTGSAATGVTAVTGSRQRTLRDLLDRELVERAPRVTSGPNVGVPVWVSLTERGRSAWLLWGETSMRLQ